MTDLRPFGRAKRRLRRPVAAKLRMERLESRQMLSADTVSDSAMDVNKDDAVSALDALLVLNAVQSGQDDSHFDVNQDDLVTPLDALQIINYLDSGFSPSQSQVQGESTPSATTILPAEIRQRDTVQLTIDTLVDLDLSQTDSIEIKWGDGQSTFVPSAQATAPFSRLHRYVDRLGATTVTINAVMNNAQVIELASESIDIVANSPRVSDLVDEGLTASIYSSSDWSGSPLRVRNDPTVRFDFGSGGPDPDLGLAGSTFSVRWQGSFVPNQFGTHTFFADVGPNDSATVLINGQTLFSTQTSTRGELTLQAGQPVPIEIRYSAGASDARVMVGVETTSSYKTALPSDQLRPSTMTQQLRGGVLAEEFVLPTASSIKELRESQSFVTNTPSTGYDLSDFRYSQSGGTRGSRIRGFITPPETGFYHFHLAASDDAELWLSTGKSSDHSRLLAAVQSATSELGFNDPTAGQSKPVYLIAGHEYYVETLHVHDDAQSTDHLSVGWTIPSQSGVGPQLLPGTSLRPVTGTVVLHSEVSQTHEAASVSQGSEFVIARNDDLGRALQVRYTVGGKAKNGIDFQTLSGIATIPAGARSVSVSLSPIDDAVVEGPEEAVIRLVSDPNYQLGPESQRQIIQTILGEIHAATELFPSDPLLEELLPPDFNSVGSPAFVVGIDSGNLTRLAESDPSLPFDEKATIDVNQFSQPFSTMIGYRFSPQELPNNTPLLAVVWARSGNANGSDVSVGIRLQESGDDFSGVEKVWQVSDQWTPLIFPTTPDFGGSTIDRSIDIRLGYQDQIVELGGFRLFQFSSQADLDFAPKPLFTYEGRQWDSTWREGTLDRTEGIRTNPVQIKLVDASGNPITSAKVSVTPLSSPLPLGTTVSPERVVDGESLSTDFDSIRYTGLLQSFDSLTDAGTGQWGPWSQNQQTPTEFLNWVVDRDKPYHGHALVWGQFSETNFNFPTPDSLLDGYNDQLTNNGAAVAKTWLRSEILNHVGTTGPAGAFAGTRSGSAEPLVTWWDVINHPIFSSQIWDIVDQQFIVEVLQAARDASDPQTRLIINEFDILSNLESGLSDDFFALLGLLDQTAPGGTAQYDTIGFQGHFVSDRLPAIDAITQELDRYGVFGRDIQITEFDLDAVDIDRQTQADFTRDFYEVIAAHPLVTATTFWGFWAGDHWREGSGALDERAALFDLDWTPRPNGQWLLDQQTSSKRPLSLTVIDDQPIAFSVPGEQMWLSVEIDGQESRPVLVEIDSQKSVQVISVPTDVVVIDNLDAGFAIESGNWGAGSGVPGFVGTDYRFRRGGNVTASFTGQLLEEGVYEVFATWTAHPNRATNARFDVVHRDGTTTVEVDQTQPSGSGVSLGFFAFDTDTPARVAVRTLGTDGFVVADSIRFEKASFEKVIDNEDAAFTVESGNWKVSSSIAGFVGQDYAFAGSGDKTVRYNADVPMSGYYEVLASWTSHPNRASNARFDIVHSEGTSIVQVDQTVGGGGFQSLGYYRLEAGQPSSVAVRTLGSNGVVVADAIKLKFVEGYLEIDNEDPSFAIESGSWGTIASIPGFIGSNYRFTGGSGKTARFDLSIPQSGIYEVFATWMAHPTRATNATYQISHQHGNSLVVVDQTVGGSAYQSLGVYEFSDDIAASVSLIVEDANGSVVADAIRLVRVD